MVCKTCKQQINDGASKCPFCQEWVGINIIVPFSLFVLEVILAIILFWVISTALFYIVGKFVVVPWVQEQEKILEQQIQELYKKQMQELFKSPSSQNFYVPSIPKIK